MSARIKDYYAILQVLPEAERTVIRAAYRSLSQVYHPDKDPSPEAQAKMVEINEAYEVLSDQDLREAYDKAKNNGQARHASNQIGPYEIIREIARSCDIVYEGWDPAIDRRVAIKVLDVDGQMSPELLAERKARFAREAKAAGRLIHPNIVPVYAVGEDEGQHYFVMELVEGPTLGTVIKKKGPLELTEVKSITNQLLSALDCAHSHEIVHRDLKPENIFYLKDGIVKLADFGIAKITTDPSMTATGQIFGTVHYMSPEQAQGKEIDGRSDLWSLGVIIYYLLCGRRPFVGPNNVAVLSSILQSTPDMSPIRDPAVRSVVKKALAKDPQERYSSAAEMKSAIRGVSQSQTGAPQSAGPSPQPSQVASAGRIQPIVQQRPVDYATIAKYLSFAIATVWIVVTVAQCDLGSSSRVPSFGNEPQSDSAPGSVEGNPGNSGPGDTPGDSHGSDINTGGRDGQSTGNEVIIKDPGRARIVPESEAEPETPPNSRVLKFGEDETT